MEIIQKECTVSKVVATSRIYALISVVCAHLPFADSVIGTLFERFGTVGVIVFFIISGYYYNPGKFQNIKDLIVKKFKSVCVPWLVLGSFVWLYNVILSSKFRSITGYIKWILGNGTFLYYVPMLLLCFALLYRASVKTLKIFVMVNVISVVLTASGILASLIELFHITNYINIFNWIGFFALGMLLREFDETTLIRFLLKARWIVTPCFCLVLIIAVFLKSTNFTYFSYLGIPFELLGALTVFSVSTMPLVKWAFFSRLSDCSYAIYLTHMVFVGLLDSLLNKSLFSQIVSPVIIILAVYMLLMVGLFVFNRTKLSKWYCLVTGIRIKI